jgi:hypothetical protein
MTTRGKQIAGAIAVLGVIAMPRQLDCTFPGDYCKRVDARGRLCQIVEREPLAVYALESLLGRDLKIYYSRSERCER